MMTIMKLVDDDYDHATMWMAEIFYTPQLFLNIVWWKIFPQIENLKLKERPQNVQTETIYEKDNDVEVEQKLCDFLIRK